LNQGTGNPGKSEVRIGGITRPETPVHWELVRVQAGEEHKAGNAREGESSALPALRGNKEAGC